MGALVDELERWAADLRTALGLDPSVVVDVTAVLDLARVAAHAVDRPAAPLTTYLVGYAAGRAAATGDPTTSDELAARAAELADRWTPSA